MLSFLLLVLPGQNGLHSCLNSSLSSLGQAWQDVHQFIGWSKITVQPEHMDFVDPSLKNREEQDNTYP
jgi:hypothetical protein